MLDHELREIRKRSMDFQKPNVYMDQAQQDIAALLELVDELLRQAYLCECADDE